MKELSIFVDESGDFGIYQNHSPYYVVTMLFHDQSVDISKEIERLNHQLSDLNYPNIAVHTEPLIRREEIYRNDSPNHRRAVFSRLFFFAMRVDFKFWSLVIEKKAYPDTLRLEGRIHKEITGFVRHNLAFFQSFDRVVLYYDNGQHQLNRILNMVLGTELSGYEIKKVLPADYRLFQVADMICTLKLLERKIEHGDISKFERLLFHSKRDLRKDFLKGIAKKQF